MNKGFTLAEVLITLGVIGVVSAMTLPTLIQKQRDKANVAKLQKVYSVLSQAVLRAKNEQGEFSAWSMPNSQAGCNEVFANIKPYIKYIKDCGNKSGCWAENVKSLTGGDARWYGNNLNALIQNGYYSFILSDGTNVIIDILSIKDKSIKDSFGINLQDFSNDYTTFVVDINGNKAPNVAGRDIFIFLLSNKGLVPAGYYNTTNCTTDSSKSTTDAGFTCAFKVLQEKGINY